MKPLQVVEAAISFLHSTDLNTLIPSLLLYTGCEVEYAVHVSTAACVGENVSGLPVDGRLLDSRERLSMKEPSYLGLTP